MVCTHPRSGAVGFFDAALFVGALFIGAGSILSISSAIADEPDAPNNQTTHSVAMQGCETMSVGGAEGWEPITYIDENGRQLGLAIDILDEYAARHGIHLDLMLDIPWSRSIQMLGKGELDVIAGAYFTKERNRIYTYSAPFSFDDVMVFQHRQNRFPMNNIYDLIGYRGARPQGGSYGDYIDHYAQTSLDMIYSPTGNRIFDVLINGRADYVILGRYDGLTNLYKNHLEDVIEPAEPPLARNEVLLMFSRQSPCAQHIAEINLLIKRLKEDGTLERWTTGHLRGVMNETPSDS